MKFSSKYGEGIGFGIDYGGSAIKGAPVDLQSGKLLTERYRIPLAKTAHPFEAIAVIKHILDYFEWDGDVGLGYPGVVLNGKIIKPGNLNPAWEGMDAEKALEEHCGLRFKAINDADAAGLAEMHFGAGKNENGLVVMVTAGTGLGSGVFFNKTLIPNFEMGRLYRKDGKYIETYAADSARIRDGLTYADWGKRFNKFLKMVERLCYPNLIIIGGGSSKYIDKFSQKFTITTPWKVAKFENQAGIIGAAMAVKP